MASDHSVSGAAELVVADRTPPWQEGQFPTGRCLFAGDKDSIEEILLAWHTSGNLEDVASTARRAGGTYAFVAITKDGVLAATDHCRSWPVFFGTSENGQFAVGPVARAIRHKLDISQINSNALLEARTSGYVFDGETLFEGLNQLLPGEVIFRSAAGSLNRCRSFCYSPTTKHVAGADINLEQAVEKLAIAIDRAIDDVVDFADGAPILVPLSGGLDSRLIVAKLHERSYPDLHTFSYGPPGNAEARAAMKVADHLSLPWQYVSTKHSETRNFYRSEVCRQYVDFADNDCSLPNFQDLLPLIKLLDAGGIPANSVIVNGQTGDFISGGHIPLAIVQGQEGSVTSAIIDRHCGLWRSLLDGKSRTHLVARISEIIDSYGISGDSPRPEMLAAQFERWEYENRQAKFIVNGQRSYDFLELRWRLPLWHLAVVEAFNSTPLPLRTEQYLYREFLEDWNYLNLFKEFKPTIQAWNPLLNSLIVPVSILTRLLIGRPRRDKLMQYMRYFDRYGNHYGAFGWKTFASNAHDIRNPAALYSRTWLQERGVL